MRITVSSDIFNLLPRMKIVVAYGEGLNNVGKNEEVEKLLVDSLRSFQENWNYPNPQSHPHIAGWRKVYKTLGISSNYPCSIENLVRRVSKGKELPRINPLVDFYNALSLQYVSPFGAFALSNNSDIELRHTRQGELFTELGSVESQQCNENEIAYVQGETLLSRHFVWRQSEQGKIHATTNAFVLLSEVIEELGNETVNKIEKSIVEGIKNCFGIEVRTEIVSN